MNLRNSSHPDETDTVDVRASIKAFVACFNSARRPAMVPTACIYIGRTRGLKMRLLLELQLALFQMYVHLQFLMNCSRV